MYVCVCMYHAYSCRAIKGFMIKELGLFTMYYDD